MIKTIYKRHLKESIINYLKEVEEEEEKNIK